MGSSRTKARTCVPCIGRWILNHCATTEAPKLLFKFNLMLKNNATFDERTCETHTQQNISGLDSSHIENSKDKPISTGHFISQVQSFPTGIWRAPNYLRVCREMLMAVKFFIFLFLFFLIYFLLKYSWFTMCWFLVYSKVIHLYIEMCSFSCSIMVYAIFLKW